MPSYPIDPDKLLEQAAQLAGEDAGPGHPSYTNLRRAVPSAYYAAFQTVSDQIARGLFPGRASFQQQLLQAVEHFLVQRDADPHGP